MYRTFAVDCDHCNNCEKCAENDKLWLETCEKINSGELDLDNFRYIANKCIYYRRNYYLYNKITASVNDGTIINGLSKYGPIIPRTLEEVSQKPIPYLR